MGPTWHARAMGLILCFLVVVIAVLVLLNALPLSAPLIAGMFIALAVAIVLGSSGWFGFGPFGQG